MIIKLYDSKTFSKNQRLAPTTDHIINQGFKDNSIVIIGPWKDSDYLVNLHNKNKRKDTEWNIF